VAPLLFYKCGQIFNAFVVLPNASRFRWVLLYVSGVLRLTPAYLVYKSPIDYHESKNFEANDG